MPLKIDGYCVIFSVKETRWNQPANAQFWPANCKVHSSGSSDSTDGSQSPSACTPVFMCTPSRATSRPQLTRLTGADRFLAPSWPGAGGERPAHSIATSTGTVARRPPPAARHATPRCDQTSRSILMIGSQEREERGSRDRQTRETEGDRQRGQETQKAADAEGRRESRRQAIQR